MTALDAYRNLLRELDKFESPTFTVGDFNYFYNAATSQYITDNYGEFDVFQKDLDDIRAIVKYGEPLEFTGESAPLPSDYRHLLSLEVDGKITEELRDYSPNDIVKLYPKRLETNRKGYVADNAYQNASVHYPAYQIDGTSIYVYAGNGVELTGGKADYIKVPATVYLNPDKNVDLNDPVNNSVLQFPDYVNLEIIKLCRQIFLENIQSPRWQTSMQENQLSKIKE